ncbi:amidohydrolase [Luminiphilus syltensis NOR5-1B]|uniref:Amidohydrolase n=1 Tax=Luminiphilus syltensis NOR5-1B TaxID=565045 RepID=B8KXQ0_9GAMM|nr:amidohydrolase family protein [Luminiphilus syltensis]EED35814.1 amidohydrolase [Luminiphilus syltensis NOR5-1B]
MILFSKTRARLVVAATAVFCTLAQADTVIFDNVTLIDGTGRDPLAGISVVVEDGKFSQIAPAETLAGVEGTRIDGTGRYLIPGLMDMHIHLKGGVTVTETGLREAGNDRQVGLAALASYLYSGVTAVYDSGNNPDYIFALRDEERSGSIESPRIFATGGIVTYPGSHGSGPGYTPVDDWPEAKAALDDHIARKPDILKLTLEERGWGARPMIPLLPVDLMQKVIEYYNDHGIRTTVHTSSERRARQAIFAGIDNLSHPIIQGPATEAFGRLMGAKKIPMVTTLAIGEGYSRLAESPDFLDQPLYQASLSADEIETLKTETRPAWQERKWTWWMQIMTPIAQEGLALIHNAGGVLVLGTDQTIGPAVHHEMKLLADAGIPAKDIIRIATLNGAEFLGRETDMGSIEVGKLADAVLLTANPVEDITNTRSIELVMKNGRVIDRQSLPVAGTALR